MKKHNRQNHETRKSNQKVAMERAISERENNPGTPVFAHYTSARRWYAPHDLAKVNNSEIERVTEMDKKKLLLITDSCII